MKQLLNTIACLFICIVSRAQANNNMQEATGLRADGKIWVVMAVCITILAGLFVYVIRLDRKISRLEKRQ